MSDLTGNNKKLVEDFFSILSSGSQDYLGFYTEESIIWTAGENAIGGSRSKGEVVGFAQSILDSFPESGLWFRCHLFLQNSPQ